MAVMFCHRAKAVIVGSALWSLGLTSFCASPAIIPLPAQMQVHSGIFTLCPTQQVAGASAYARTRILELMVKGLIKKEIADSLGVSYHTVNNHLRSIYEKLHVHTRGGAVAKALNERLF